MTFYDFPSTRFSAQAMVGVVHQYLRIVRSLRTHTELLLQGYYSYMWGRPLNLQEFCLVAAALTASIFLFFFDTSRMKLRRECGEAVHSIALITVRLQSCLVLQQRSHTLWVCLSTRQDSCSDVNTVGCTLSPSPLWDVGFNHWLVTMVNPGGLTLTRMVLLVQSSRCRAPRFFRL